jgi:hypothetical protein
MPSLTMEAQQAYNPAHARVDSGADKAPHKTTGNIERTIKAINYGHRSVITKVEIGGVAVA